MKRLLLVALVGFFSLPSIWAQTPPPIVTVYNENFDQPSGPDSVITYNTDTLTFAEWNDTTHLQVSQQHSYHTKILPFDSVIFETNSFSTVGNIFVRLKFQHIAKIHFGQRGYLQASNDGGNTWVTLSGSEYQGNSPQFSSTGYFNELSYPAPGGTPYWGGLSSSPTAIVPPTNQWWAEETFNLSAILGDTNGFPNCKIRFIAAYQFTTTISPSGWYIDNILVEAAPCELDPPQFTYNLTIPRKPVGARYNPSQEVRLKAYDFGGMNQGLDSVVVWYRYNNGPWQDSNMTALTGGSCPDSSIYTFNFTNINVGDTIDWYVEIFDCACPNLTRDPLITALPNYYTFWRDIAPPPICGLVSGNTFPFVVQAYPWTEDFEGSGWQAGTGDGLTGTAHRGAFPSGNPASGGQNWKVQPPVSSTGFAWSVRTGGTATNNTGPAGNNTPTGSRYVYTEASQGNGAANPQFTQLITPCIDLGLVNCAALEFYYHMFGNNIDLLRVDVDTGTNTNQYVNGVLRITGPQNVNENDAYNKAVVSLEQFAGDIVRIRFTGRKTTPINADRNDIAIDDITIFEPTPIDVELIDYLEPERGFCSYSANEVVKASLRSLGCQTITSIPVACRIEYTDLSGTVTNTVIRDTLLGSYSLASDTTFTFTPTADLSGYGTYKMWVWSEVPNDTIATNDTVGPYAIEHLEPINTFPYILDFDDPNTIPGNGTATNPGIIGSPFWHRIPDPTLPGASGYAWFVIEGSTPSPGTGPIGDYGDNGNYMYTEGNLGTSPVSAQLVSECFDLSGMTSPVIDFRYYMFGPDIGGIAVQVVPPGSNSWTNITGNLILNTSANNHTNAKSPWKYWSVDLSNYAGDFIKIRILGQKTGFGVGADVAIDDIRVYDQLPTDVGIELIQPPGPRINLASPVAPTFTIRNYGTNSVSNIPITYTITPLCGPNAGTPTTYNVTFAGSIAAGGTAVYSVSAANMPTYPEGDFEICGTTNKSGDANTFNDTFCGTSVGWPTYSIQNGFLENFDNCNEGTPTGFWKSGDYRIWDLGTPTGGAGSAPNAYATSLFGFSSYPGTEEFLNAPRLDGFDTIVGAQLWIRHDFSFGTGDAGIIEFLDNGNWTLLGFRDPDNAVGFNWYNTPNVSIANNASAWQGASNGWETSMWPLTNYNFSLNPLVIRWKLISAGGGTSKWDIDDVEIRIPPQNSASPILVDTKEFIPVPDQNNTIRIRIQNTGAKRLDSCLVQFSTTGPNGPYSPPEKIIFDPPLFNTQISGWYEFQTPWASPPSGQYNVCVLTSRPNNKQDNLTIDDTNCVEVIVPDKIVFSATDTSYCNDFEDASQTEWIAFNWPDKQGLLSWEKGTPNQTPINGAYSGSNAWMTNLTNNYRQRDSSSLFTPFFVLDSGQAYEMSFWHNFNSELYHDGGSIDVSFDGWVTFQTVGYVLPSGDWFNTTHVTALDILRPGWTGDSQGWIQSKLKMSFEAPPGGKTMQFRFRFGSDQSFEYQGWAIDDFCVNKSNEIADIFIGIEEDELNGLIGVGNVIPNPSSGETMIPYVMNDPSNVHVSIYSMLGQQLLHFEQTSEQGINQIKFDVTGWSPGMYIVAIEVQGELITRKVIVK
jgi:hypothetical protein